MSDYMNTIDELRMLYPELHADELLNVAETLRRYVVLAREIGAQTAPLTETADGGNLGTGAVDPGIFTTTTG
jgi:hypothetical protein